MIVSIYDNLNLILKNLTANLAENGELYLFANFNEFGYNLYAKYEDLNNKNDPMKSYTIKINKFFFFH